MKYVTLSFDSEKFQNEKGSIRKVRVKNGYIPALCVLPEGAAVQAYTKLKKPGKNKFLYKDRIFNLSAKKGIFRRPLAYLPLEDRNMYVCITAFTLWPLIILLMLLLAFLLLGRCTPGEKPEKFSPRIEEVTESQPGKGRTDGGQIKIKGFTGISILAETGEGNVLFENPAGNNCYFVFSLYTKDNTLLYKSKMLPPGRDIRTIRINKKLPAGEYDGYIHIDTYSAESGSEMNKAKFNIKIHVN